MRRLCIYSFYDNEGVVEPYVTKALEGIRSVCDRIIVCVNGEITPDSKELVKSYADECVIRDNIGFDAGAHKETICRLIASGELYEYDELLISNNTYYGFFYPLEEVYERISQEVDFWGITGNEDECNDISWHVQSYFVNYRRRLLHSDTFRDFWQNYEQSTDIDRVIREFEIGSSKAFIEAGYKAVSLYGDSMRDDVYEDIVAGCPILKIKALELLRGFEVVTYLELNNIYDTEMMKNNVTRRKDKYRIYGNWYNPFEMMEFCKHHKRIFIYGNGKKANYIKKFLYKQGIDNINMLVTSLKDEDDAIAFNSFMPESGDGIIMGMREDYIQEVIGVVKQKFDIRNIYMSNNCI